MILIEIRDIGFFCPTSPIYLRFDQEFLCCLLQGSLKCISIRQDHIFLVRKNKVAFLLIKEMTDRNIAGQSHVLFRMLRMNVIATPGSLVIIFAVSGFGITIDPYRWISIKWFNDTYQHGWLIVSIILYKPWCKVYNTEP